MDELLAGKTLKEYFEMQEYSTAQIKKWKFEGQILANGKAVTVRYVLQEGDVVTLSATHKATPMPSTQKAEIVWQDEFLYVANKPQGVAIHPDRAHKTDTLGNRLAATFGKDFELRIVTRLDKSTSGLVLGALDGVTAQRLNKLQLEHKISKQYVACVEGKMREEYGEIDFPLLRLDSQNKTIVDGAGKRSMTRFKTLWSTAENADMNENSPAVVSKLLITPITGRTHQIRAHLAEIGHPIVGDVLYGAQPSRRIMLHCARLAFVHPMTGQTVEVSCAEEF